MVDLSHRVIEPDVPARGQHVDDLAVALGEHHVTAPQRARPVVAHDGQVADVRRELVGEHGRQRVQPQAPVVLAETVDGSEPLEDVL